MGFGCNAAGVAGCRIVDDSRERAIAILTNALVPCNGRFPAIIALISIFFVGDGPMGALAAAGLLTGFVLLGIGMTFFTSFLLSRTACRGEGSSFALELPPYRKPRIGQVIVRSLLDRTIFVLGRAVTVAAPAGVLIWCLANISMEGQTLLEMAAAALDPIAMVFGMNGVIFLAFILGFPANELVLPIVMMTLLSSGTLAGVAGVTDMGAVLLGAGWTPLTALCTIVFVLFHWPCSTTCLTIAKETGSYRMALGAIALPTAVGLGLCLLIHLAALAF
ncbi:MAG: nucleoside recognition domain-containing protein [Oscillospiraceae bacterium]|nr:nucleoside recognition domain-containing protein [Oscillospiraceae bacterium]